MALYRPTVTRRRKDGTKYHQKSKLWWGSFRHPMSDMLMRIPLKTADKKAAKTLLAEAERRAAREAAGLVSPFERHNRRPLIEHIDEWKTSLLDKGSSAVHVDIVTTRARKIIETCGFDCWPRISASRVQGFVGDLRRRGMSPQTRNFYLQAIKQFAKWMIEDRRANSSPVAYLKPENVRNDRRHDRRALSVSELRRLLSTAENGPERYGMSGFDRATLYTLAVESGLRVAELRSLTWDSLDLGGSPATVTVMGAYSKSKRTDTLPLTAATACRFGRWRDLLGKVDPRDRLFPTMPDKLQSAKLIRTDLDMARATWIKEAPDNEEQQQREASDFLRYIDSAGLYADFHSLRHTFITNLAIGGVAPKVAQDLARHCDINLTLTRYSHTVLPDRAAALDALPDLSTTERTQRHSGAA